MYNIFIKLSKWDSWLPRRPIKSPRTLFDFTSKVLLFSRTKTRSREGYARVLGMQDIRVIDPIDSIDYVGKKALRTMHREEKKERINAALL